MCLVRTIKDKQCGTELTTRRPYIYSLSVLTSMLHMHDHEVAKKARSTYCPGACSTIYSR